MPVYRQTYRSFEGKFVRRYRWWIVLEQELRVLWSFRIFKFLCFLALLHVLLRALQIFAYDIIRQDPNHILTPLLNQATFLMINRQMFFDFISLQIPLTFLMLLYAGSGMICNDFRNNLIEVYFSKPMRWHDYVFGKSLALIFVGVAMTAIPGTLLVIMHNIFLPSWDLLFETLPWILSIFAYSLAVVLSCALAILASSSLIASQGYAAIVVIMLAIANSAITGLLAELLRERDYLVFSYPFAIDYIGRTVFQIGRLPYDLSWHWPVGYLTVVCGISFLIMTFKIRRAEIAA